MGFAGCVGSAGGVVVLHVWSCMGGEGVPPVSFVSGELGLPSLFLVSCVSILHAAAIVGSMLVEAPSIKSRRSGGEGVPEYAGKYGARGC